MTAKRKWMIALSVGLLLLALGGLIFGLHAMENDEPILPTGENYHTGRVIVKGNGVLFVDEHNSPVVLHDASVGGNLFAGLQTGDKVQVYYEFVMESYPAQAYTDYCRLIERGTPEDIPAETQQQLASIGWLTEERTATDCTPHTPVATPQTVDDPVIGYCGNTRASLTVTGETVTFYYGDAVTLTDILINLAYDPSAVCRCEAEFTADTEMAAGTFEVNLTKAFVRCDAGQAALTAEQVQALQEIVKNQTLCGYPLKAEFE